MINLEALRDLCILLMCSEAANEELKCFADAAAHDHGFTDWLDAYHQVA